MSDGSLLMYVFINNELAGIAWASKKSERLDQTVLIVRNALVRAHGQPTIESAARLDSQGSVAKITREVYRPPIDKNCVVSLVATSEGVEVQIADETIYKKHGRPLLRQSYEEAVEAVSAVVKPTEKQSTIVDLLAASKVNAEGRQEAINPEPLSSELPATPSRAGTSGPSALVSTVAESPKLVAASKTPMWRWGIGIAALVVIIMLAFRRRA